MVKAECELAVMVELPKVARGNGADVDGLATKSGAIEPTINFPTSEVGENGETVPSGAANTEVVGDCCCCCCCCCCCF